MTSSNSKDGSSKKELVPRVDEDPSCRVQNVIPTSTVFAAALERLNRQSVIHLLQQIIQEVDQHCQLYGREKTEELGRVRTEMMALLVVLQKTTEEQRGEITVINQRIGELAGQFQKHKLKQGGADLSPPELKQVEALVLKLIASYDFTAIFAALRVTVNGRSLPLERLIEVLATVDKVVDTHIDYSDADVTGARMVLADRTQILFVCLRREQPGGNQIHYLFQTEDWKGVPASFTLIFERRNTEMQVCGRTVVLTSYDGVFQSNIKFDLCPQAGVA